jgi:hypothetical protein
LRAALAVWEYAEQSAEYIFGAIVGHPLADELLRALRKAGTKGLSRTEMRDLFKRNRSSEEIDGALEILARHGYAAKRENVHSRGRPAEIWVAT